jgi:hypothetical protein
MAVFGLVYKALPSWANGASPSLGLARTHFYACVVAVIGVVANGIIGYTAKSARVSEAEARAI